jgi:hypothetical protein
LALGVLPGGALVARGVRTRTGRAAVLALADAFAAGAVRLLLVGGFGVVVDPEGVRTALGFLLRLAAVPVCPQRLRLLVAAALRLTGQLLAAIGPDRQRTSPLALLLALSGRTLDRDPRHLLRTDRQLLRRLVRPLRLRLRLRLGRPILLVRLALLRRLVLLLRLVLQRRLVLLGRPALVPRR